MVNYLYGRSQDIKMRDRNAWLSLGLQNREGMSGSHDRAEYWVAELEERYFHKYLSIEDDKHQVSSWKEVDPEMFIQHIPFLGMQVQSKSYGELENAIKVQYGATAGMAF